MKSVRIFYKKMGRMKFVSHLDMNRLMPKIIKKAGIPAWYTEGFNQHIYVNYAVPLSLGFEGLYEVMDIKLFEEEFSLSLLLEKLNSVSPEGIDFFDAAYPVLETKDVCFAEYKITFDDDSLFIPLTEFLKRDSVVCLKKDKKGRMKEFDLIPKIKSFSFEENTLIITLTAGNEGNLNPTLLLSTFFSETKTEQTFYSVKRTAIFDKNLALFK